MLQAETTMQSPLKRQTAHAFWISDISQANIDTSQQYPSFAVREKNVIRANLIAIVTSKYVSENGSYATIGIDDGTGTIQVKAWNEDAILITRQEVGNVVMVIGKLGVTASKEIYVRPEIIRHVEMPWLVARKKELESKFGVPSAKAIEPVVEESVVDDVVSAPSKFAVRAKIVEILNQNPDGMDEQKLADISGYNKADAMKAINELIREGEIYYSRPGIVKGI